jgi:hypothetical protein
MSIRSYATYGPMLEYLFTTTNNSSKLAKHITAKI